MTTVIWRCLNPQCGRKLGEVTDGQVYIEQTVHGKLRKIVAPQPVQQQCICGWRQSMPPATRSGTLPA
jgi:hypothetical protein